MILMRSDARSGAGARDFSGAGMKWYWMSGVAAPGRLRTKAPWLLGIKEVDDGIWLVSFMHYDLGYIDLEQKTLQPLDNPFGPRLSPMS